ncbi:hypothetical protein [uncultured Jannaschia sp.]|uniref:hypothetical protein n=1 Tax=uncultured Jannaschia sp. TaxID=293347 RepID=UPI00262AA292|nr:hypothetical protein [uncultured Jannaschia sp.]
MDGSPDERHHAQGLAVLDHPRPQPPFGTLLRNALPGNGWLWGRFVASRNLLSVVRCHVAALEAVGGVPEEILYDRMKTAVIGEDDAGVVTYDASLVALLNHYCAVPQACRPYRAKTKGSWRDRGASGAV